MQPSPKGAAATFWENSRRVVRRLPGNAAQYSRSVSMAYFLKLVDRKGCYRLRTIVIRSFNPLLPNIMSFILSCYFILDTNSSISYIG